MKPSDRLTCALALMLAWLPDTALAQTIELDRTVSGHVILDLEIGDHGVHTFAIDTGANRTAIAQAVAEDMGFQSSWIDSNDVQSLTRLFEVNVSNCRAFACPICSRRHCRVLLSRTHPPATP